MLQVPPGIRCLADAVRMRAFQKTAQPKAVRTTLTKQVLPTRHPWRLCVFQQSLALERVDKAREALLRGGGVQAFNPDDKQKLEMLIHSAVKPAPTQHPPVPQTTSYNLTVTALTRSISYFCQNHALPESIPIYL